jgi:hypothetical protein
MKILCVGQVEEPSFIKEQVKNQTIEVEDIIFHIDEEPAVGIEARRRRIAENHIQLKHIVEAYEPDFVFQVEQDAVLPENALERMIGHYYRLDDPNFGYISGIQVGRHGLYCLGAWNFDKDREAFESIDYKLNGLQKIDATGFYCLFAPRDVWLNGICTWDNERWGPDVNWGLSIRKNKYVDMGLHIGHKTNSGIIDVSQPTTCNARFYKHEGQWVYKQLN